YTAMKTVNRLHKVVIGRAEELNLVELGLFDVPVKIDTGAYRSAIHASNIHLSADKKTLHFSLLEGHPYCGQSAKDTNVANFKRVTISNSFGDSEQRYEVTLKVKL